MIDTESPELLWLAATVLLTGVLWVPYVGNRFRELGPPNWSWFPLPDPPQRAPWAMRAVQAHVNAVENLVLFAPLALAAHVIGPSAVTAGACRVYFFTRLAHALGTIAGVPIPFRTAAFLIGFACELILGFAILLRS
ncbi:MAG: MAPEG family protein [Rhodospirillum sp.]|nr:MAPEG family protein [Rhodospirillum sp.]MCF8502978.1 MAPEG family protein [Rhodospirillum sp.]